jgi:hypothetical protein
VLSSAPRLLSRTRTRWKFSTPFAGNGTALLWGASAPASQTAAAKPASRDAMRGERNRIGHMVVVPRMKYRTADKGLPIFPL